ncbi:MAG: sigma-54 dependent transcriptional regulator [Elusimicrobia bacterium]|nr:sigma-54 dependent transcriptional regulator [Elusimicrobiota bacterium]
MIKKKILIIEDDDLMLGMIRDLLVKEGYEVSVATDGFSGYEEFQKSSFDLVLLDIKLPKMDGITLLKKIKEFSSETMAIIMTGYGTVETAVEAMKVGAYDYITKPFLSEELVLLINKALEFQSIKQENVLLHKELNHRYQLCSIIGKSKSMQKIYDLIETVAPSNATVLIQGESGTGKELVAEAIHHLSQRKDKPLIKVNCAALPETLLESELFGHEKGAFTDAINKRIGRFELAHEGTLFLDDIDNMNPAIQIKLLRILQEKEFERVGGTKTIKVDVRIIAASRPNLQETISKGTFREDLYYRLNVIPVFLPPLRERKEDIPLLVKHFLDRYNRETDKNIKISPNALQLMLHYEWPGNIRELQHLIERLITIFIKDEILPADLPPVFNEKKKWTATTLQKALQETEKEHIVKVLEFTGWQKEKAADILGINRKTLWQKIKEYGIK